MKLEQPFELKIEKTFVRHGRIPFLVSAIMILMVLLGFYAYTHIFQVLSVQKNVSNTLTSLHQSILTSYNLIEDDSTLPLEKDLGRAYQYYYSINNASGNNLDVLIFSNSDEPFFITQPALQGSNFLKYYQSIILEQLNRNDFLTTTIPQESTGLKPYVVIARNQKDSLGNLYKILYFIDPNYYQMIVESQRSNHVVITDIFNNVIATTSDEFLTTYNKFLFEKNTVELTHTTYTIRTQTMEGHYKIHVAVPKVYVSWQLGLVGALFLSTFILIQQLNKKSARKIGNEISESMTTLMKGIEEINRGNYDFSINLDTHDEFEAFARAFEAMGQQLNEAMINNKNLLELSKNAEIKQLEAQFNPHFLYNSLEVIRYLMIDDPQRAESLLVGITKLLRYSIRRGNNTVPLSDDMEYINLYLEVHKLRLQERFEYTLEIEEEVKNFNVPKLILQPLIENCIKHGFKNRSILNVGVMAYALKEDIYLHVFDDGSGMDPHYVEYLNEYEGSEQGDTYGILSVIQRIKLIYGNQGKVLIESDNHGTHVMIVIKGGKDHVA